MADGELTDEELEAMYPDLPWFDVILGPDGQPIEPKSLEDMKPGAANAAASVEGEGSRWRTR